ncbi:MULTISPECIES: M20 metallopeptidase family protein [Amycolatopsis]|uniref:Amidohydrolase n=2 Tax=Amycolatopsis TaxID=1813 RepID=A0A1I4BLQ3_9PSEU|nr:M20 family metallopeptidase [Amycolatopsis sacchari]SFK69483.1 amidohydrolase [Amycolatopsis sacchari]
MTDGFDRLRHRVEQELPAAVQLRHELHRKPRLSGDEAATRDTVLAALPSGTSAQPVAGTGAVLRIGGTGSAVAVRAELDALSVTEGTGLPWASEHPGVMHACGHDVHLAATVALARAVEAVGGPAPLVVVLQPREETYPSGALEISESGVLAEQQAGATVAAHVQPLLPTGTVACSPGPVNASSDEFTVTVAGRGGHAAYPHQTADPVVALASVVVALQSMVSRGTDPMTPVVLSVTTLAAGSAPNVVPDEATARGTVRSLDPAAREVILERLAETVDLVSRAHGCTGRVEVTEGEPVLENDAGIARAAAPLLRRLGAEVDDTLRSAGSDDFAYFSQAMPSLMMFVGTGGAGQRLHSATYAPGDEYVGHVAGALLAGYLAAAEVVTGGAKKVPDSKHASAEGTGGRP